MKSQSKLKDAFFSIYSYSVIYALFGVLSLSYHACFNSSLSTLEKRYHFSSSTGGLIMITDNIATVLTNLFIGYYGKTAHKPRWMSIGCVVTGLSVMITALPYFIYGAAQEREIASFNTTIWPSQPDNGDQLCLASPVQEDCSVATASATSTMTMVAVACFAISNFFRGFGTSIYFTYGTPYLDDNVSKAKMPTFFAFIFAARIFGAPIGFFLSSLALRIYENPFAKPANLDPQDPRWIGAWWIGFLVSGMLMLLLAIPLSLFPREFKKKNNNNNKSSANESSLSNMELAQLSITEQTANGNSQQQAFETNDDKQNVAMIGNQQKSNSSEEEQEQEQKKETPKQELSLQELPREVFEILRNPIILCQMMGNLFRGIGIIGYFVFQTKYLESQFRQSASKASIVSGTTGFVAKLTGVILGGVLITCFRPGARKLTIFIFLVELTSVFTLLYGASVIGPQYAYPGTQIRQNGQLDLFNTCNANCHCENVRYQPVCEHHDMKAYFSPCHAGCRQSFRTVDKSSAFAECSCISTGQSTLEKCPPDSERLHKYVLIVALGGMISGSSRSGNMVTFFRSINPEQKSLAVAVASFWHSLLVSIPYPIIYGSIFDSCCLVWSKECGKRGNCWLYDTEKLRYIYHGVSVSLIALGSLFDLIMIFLSPRLGNLYDEDEYKKASKFKDTLMFWRRFRRRRKLPIELESVAKDDRSNNQNTNGNHTKLKVTDL